MKAIIQGTAQDVTTRSYKNNDGDTVHVFDAYIGEGRFFERVSGPVDLAPTSGQAVALDCIVQAKLSKKGTAYLSVWAVGALVPAA